MADLNIDPRAPTTPQDCPICLLAAQRMVVPTSRTFEFHCERCGRFDVTSDALHALAVLPTERRPVVSEWVYRQNRVSIVPKIFERDVGEIANGPRLSFLERVRRLVDFVAERSSLPGTGVEVRGLSIEAMLQSYGRRAVDAIGSYLEGERFATWHSKEVIALTAKGFMQAEEWGRSTVASSQGFVAMWFDRAMDAAWSGGFEPAITGAGYVPRRIDKKEHTNKICDEIVAEIRRSKFVVADFSEQRQGVYYEAGFAAGLKIPVIYTCRAGEVKGLHFDVRQFNTIEWESPEQLAELLRTRIKAVIGDGPNEVS